MCLVLCKPVPCHHPFCHYFYSKMVRTHSHRPENPEDHYLSIITYQNAVLTDLYEYNKKSFESLDRLFSDTKSLSRFLSNTRHADLIMETTFSDELIFKPENSHIEHRYEIKLIEDFPKTLWKERGFSIKAKVLDNKGMPSYLNKNPRFRVFLYTMDDRPKLLNLNVSGKKVLRGTIEAEMNADSSLNFKNLVINEVTSHYTNDGFQIIVANLNSSLVKPLIISGIPVRARRLAKSK